MTQPGGRLVCLAAAIATRAGWAAILASLLVLAFLIVGAPRAYAHYGADGADGEPSTLYWIEPATLGVRIVDIDMENGPLVYYPGSHRLPYFDHTSIGVTASDQKGFERYGSYEELVRMLIAELGMERRVQRREAGLFGI